MIVRQRRFINQATDEVHPRGDQTLPLGRSRLLALTAVLTALTIVLTIGYPLPAPLSTITLAPIVLFATSVYYGPKVGLVVGAIGSAIGFPVGVALGTINLAGYPFLVFWVGIVVARGPEGVIIGVLRRFDEGVAMVVGTIYETLAFFFIDFFVTAPVFFGAPPLSSAAFAIAAFDFGTLLDLIFIGPAVILLKGLRRGFGRKYYDLPELKAL